MSPNLYWIEERTRQGSLLSSEKKKAVQMCQCLLLLLSFWQNSQLGLIGFWNIFIISEGGGGGLNYSYE